MDFGLARWRDRAVRKDFQMSNAGMQKTSWENSIQIFLWRVGCLRQDRDKWPQVSIPACCPVFSLCQWARTLPFQRDGTQKHRGTAEGGLCFVYFQEGFRGVCIFLCRSCKALKNCSLKWPQMPLRFFPCENTQTLYLILDIPFDLCLAVLTPRKPQLFSAHALLFLFKFCFVFICTYVFFSTEELVNI